MKYARKTRLIEVDSTKPETTTASDQITTAINSLANANEFSRSYFGSNSNTISELNNELQKILNRKDLIPDDRLALYNQTLNRYLFLQRESEKPAQVKQTILNTTSIIPAVQSSQSAQSESSVSPLSSLSTDFVTPISTRSPSPLGAAATPVTVSKQPLQSKIPKYTSNLPRTTPKSEILRKDRRERRQSDYFYYWNKVKTARNATK